MRRTGCRTLFFAAFAFACGFAGSAFAHGTCAMCMDHYRYCIADRIDDPGVCPSRCNACASAPNCPLMPAE